jgi:hypothetical protein
MYLKKGSPKVKREKPTGDCSGFFLKAGQDGKNASIRRFMKWFRENCSPEFYSEVTGFSLGSFTFL